MMLISGIKDNIDVRKTRKMGLTCTIVQKYSYRGFTFNNTTQFIANLTLVFAFFSFLSTCIVIAYWIFLAIFKLITRKLMKKNINTSDFEVGKSDLYYLIFIMIFQNLYIVVKSYFINGFGVNLDLIMSIILPIGTVTVIIGLFIKNLMSSKISSIKKAILASEDNVEKIRMFVSLQGQKAFEDYDFIQLLPSTVKKDIVADKIEKESLIDDLLEYEKVISFIETNFKKNNLDKKYLIYVATNLCNSKEELDAYFNDLQLIVKYKTEHKKH